MADFRLPLFVVTALALSGTASLAHAQSARTPAPVRSPAAAAETTAREAFQLNQSQQAKALELDGKAHWGLKLELQQPVTRDTLPKNIEAGAYYKVTPTIRVGGTVGLIDAKPATPEADT